MFRIALLAAVLFLPQVGACDESAVSPAPPSDELRFATWKVPPGFIDPHGPEQKFPVLFRSTRNPKAVWYDVTPYLESSGVPTPEGALAIYDLRANTVTIHNTQDNLDLAEFALGGCCFGIFTNALVDIRTYECASPKIELSADATPFSIDVLKNLPREKIRLLDQVSTVIQSGQKIRQVHTISGPAPVQKREKNDRRFPIFSERESGTKVETECVLGPDGFTFSTNFTYAFRLPLESGAVSEITQTGSFISTDDNPVVIFSSAMPGDPAKSLVVVATTSLIGFDGVKISQTPALPPNLEEAR